MIKKLITYLFIIVAVSNCNTYKTFYKTTEDTASQTNTKTKIYRFNLTNSNFNTAKNHLSQLPDLRMLNLSGASKNTDTLNSLLNEIPNPEKLQVLLLNDLDLEHIPSAIKQFKNLKQLSLNKNPKLNLDETFTTIQNLPIVFLNLQYNGLNKLPASIQFIETLSDLNLTGNNVTDAQTFTYLSQLKKLRSLWLNYNNLNVFPKTASQLKQLRNLYFEHNNIRELPEDFKQLKKVWVIHAGHNKFTSLPKQLSEMEALLLLHINNCEIKTIPEDFSSKKISLFGLIMDNNLLSEQDKLKWKKEFKGFFIISME